jgi:hypothetical protein
VNFNAAFWRWFGDSKVVDDQGRPLVVYHGTPDSRMLFTEGFKSVVRGDVFFATDSRRVAETYTYEQRAFDYQNSEPAVVPLYLSIRNPMIIDGNGQRWRGTEKYIKAAKDAGYDGVIIVNSVDDYQTSHRSKPSTVFAFFKSSQAKSALEAPVASRVDHKPIAGSGPNAGTWDARDPDIRRNPRRRR